jgi:hypothetical protein
MLISSLSRGTKRAIRKKTTKAQTKTPRTIRARPVPEPIAAAVTRTAMRARVIQSIGFSLRIIGVLQSPPRRA